MSHSSHTSLVGSIVERKAGTSVSPPGKASAKSGFPVAQHRSKSAFARAREEQKKAESSSRLPRPPTVTKIAASSPLVRNSDDGEEEDSKAEVIAKASEDWRRQMEEDNQRRVENMSAEELEDARQQILKQFGPDIAEILKQSRATRDNERVKAGIPSNKPVRPSTPRTEAKLLKSAIASRAASPDPMSPTRSDKQLRFAELTPKDVYVYESAPSSPPRKALALPAPSADDGPTVSLGQFKGTVPERSMESEDVLIKSPSPSHETSTETFDTESTVLEPEEGTPEYIRRRFFPNVAPNDPSLAWIEGSSNAASTLDPGLRFDLTGTPIPPELSRTLPAHLGLHHHAEGTHAGYTLEDIFMLSRSTVPAQRAAMLGILSSIILKLSSGSIHELLGQESSLRKRALAIAVEALHERGSVGVRAVELLWSSIVAWDADSNSIDGIELKNSSDDTFDALPLEYLMKQVSEDFETGALPEESQLQLLSVVHRLARHSDAVATIIIATSKLVANLLKRFLLLPVTDAQPNPAALDVLNTLCLSSRSNASVIADSAPTLLRFIVILPDSSLYPVPLASSLLVGTLRLYRSLASYGLCSQLATTASEHFGRLTQFVLSPACTSTELRHAWLELIEAWTVCAVDPHRTTPEHDILWTQVAGWEWGKDVLELRTRLGEDDQEAWAALWRAEAAWLEGCSVNGVKGGETEKSFAIDRLRGGFEQGNERRVLERAGQELGSLLSSMSPEDTKRTDAWKQLSRTSEVLASAIRLWLSCLPPQLTGLVETPPFFLPVPQISALCAQLTVHPLWTAIDSPTPTSIGRVHTRFLSVLLSSYLYLSRASPGVPPALWLAQASSIICRLRPGDEDQAVFILNAMSQVLTVDVLQLFGWSAVDNSGLGAILPLLTYSVEHASTRIGPLWPSPSSIQKADTQRLPHTDDKKAKFALPLPKDWLFFPLDHLLRSGQTEAFKSLPSSWNYSEVDIARATLLLAKVHRHALVTYQLDAFALSREETVFSCMKVFMLEHEQQQETSLQEVFRDSVVNRLMEDLLEPFTFGAASTSRSAPDGDKANTQHTLEHVSKRFLGEGTPFYQYYTDFVALYDSISFSHPLFARLLLPPVSMRYPVDYRKYLWADYSHVLRTIRVPLESVIASKLEEYLWPVEDSPEVLAAYLRSLVKGQTEGIIRFIAIHHVASNIWPDLRQGEGNDERATKLLQALVSQAGVDAIKDVVSYRQRRELPLVPPHCFDDLKEVRDVRKTFAAKCGQQVEERLEQLLA